MPWIALPLSRAIVREDLIVSSRTSSFSSNRPSISEMTSSRFFTSEDDPSRYLRVGSDLIRGRGQTPAAPYLGAFGSSAVHGERAPFDAPMEIGRSGRDGRGIDVQTAKENPALAGGWAARVWRPSHSCCSSCTPGESRAK